VKKFNLKLKENVNAEILLNYGFKPRYDVDTGEIVEYYRKFEIDNERSTYFTFHVFTCKKRCWFKYLSFDAWMSGFDWSRLTTKECLELLFNLIRDDIVEMAGEGE
jgi:hypothetical protein